MLQSFPFFIAFRYTRAKKRNHFISFISLSSMLGIALGVLVLITVMSVMNGFDEVIKDRIFSMANHVTVGSVNGAIADWPQAETFLEKQPHVKAASPFVNGQALLVSGGVSAPVLITGVVPEKEKTTSSLSTKMVKGSLDALKPGSFKIIVGNELAESLGVNVDDSVTVMIPQAAVTPAGIFPVLKRFRVAGIFHVGKGFGFDNQLGIINLQDAQTLFHYGKNVSGLRIRVDDFFAAPQIGAAIQTALPSSFIVTNWTDDFGALFSAVKMEKTMMFFILLLLVAIAAFNLVSGLVMTVTDKQSDIAILRTYGATPSTILKIFMIQGLIIGLFGTVLGLLGGIVVALHATEWVNDIQNLFHVQLLSSNVYYVNYLPSRLMLIDLIRVGASAIVMSFLATLYPAWKASTVEPAEALRYE